MVNDLIHPEQVEAAMKRLQFAADFQRGYGSHRLSVRREDVDILLSLASLANRPADDGGTVTILGHTLPLDSLSELRRLIDDGARIESVSFVLSPQPEGVKRP